LTGNAVEIKIIQSMVSISIPILEKLINVIFEKNCVELET